MIKRFVHFLTEGEIENWIKATFNKFKTTLEAKVKEFTGKPFVVTPSKHYFEQIDLRSSNDPKHKDNISITDREMEFIYDKIVNKFFNNTNGNGGIIKVKSPNNFKINPKLTTTNPDGSKKAEWEFQHKVTFEEHFRCIVYSVVIIIKNEGGKEIVVDKPQVKMITILPSNKDGRDDYPQTNGLTESIDFDALNYIED